MYDDPQIIDELEVLRRFGGISSYTLDRMIEEDGFPPPLEWMRRKGRYWYFEDIRAFVHLQERNKGRKLKKSQKNLPKLSPGSAGAQLELSKGESEDDDETA